MKGTILIRKRGTQYVADVQGKFGGGYSGASAGSDPGSAAAFATREMIRYATCNKEGGRLIAPGEVLSLVPEHLRTVEGRDDERE